MIRKINKEDLNTIYIMGSNYSNNFSSTYNLDSYINNSNYIALCFEEDIIKGFIICLNTLDQIEIEFLYVSEKFRRQKIAENLIKEIIKYNKNILLEVSTSNIPACNLYTKLGFNKISTRKGYYNGTDAIIMRKEYQ